MIFATYLAIAVILFIITVFVTGELGTDSDSMVLAAFLAALWPLLALLSVVTIASYIITDKLIRGNRNHE